MNTNTNAQTNTRSSFFKIQNTQISQLIQVFLLFENRISTLIVMSILISILKTIILKTYKQLKEKAKESFCGM